MGNELDDDWGDNEYKDIIEITHVVMPGYTDIITICAQYGITDWREVASQNYIKDPHEIKPGDTIIIQKIGED